MPVIGTLTTLAAGKAKRAEVNGNFSTIRTASNTYGAWVDVDATITATWTFSTSPGIANALTVGTGLTVSAGGITVTGASTITGTLGGLTGLTVASGGITVTGASTITGTLGGVTTMTATTFAGSGASLTNLPAASLTGTIAEARLPGTITTLTVTNLTATNAITGTVANATVAERLTLAGASLKVDTAEATFLNTGGAAGYITTTAPAGGGTSQWINVTVGGVACRIECVTVA